MEEGVGAVHEQKVGLHLDVMDLPILGRTLVVICTVDLRAASEAAMVRTNRISLLSVVRKLFCRAAGRRRW